jgi:hypothetical protein
LSKNPQWVNDVVKSNQYSYQGWMDRKRRLIWEMVMAMLITD